jgi:adenylylsulfate kinase-like enzyme
VTSKKSTRNKHITGEVVWRHATVTRARREQLNGHLGVVIWFTGFSGVGKSTLAHEVEERLHRIGCSTFVFDGDNVRHGLCSDLGFSVEDRAENIILDTGSDSLELCANHVVALLQQRGLINTTEGKQA